MSQKALATELFLAYTRQITVRILDFYNVLIEEVCVFGSVTSHVYVMDLRRWDKEKSQWVTVHSAGFSKNERELNSIEGVDIVDYFNGKFTDLIWDYKKKAGYVDNDGNTKKLPGIQTIPSPEVGGREIETWMEGLIAVKEKIMKHGFKLQDVLLDKHQVNDFATIHGKFEEGKSWYDLK